MCLMSEKPAQENNQRKACEEDQPDQRRRRDSRWRQRLARTAAD